MAKAPLQPVFNGIKLLVPLADDVNFIDLKESQVQLNVEKHKLYDKHLLTIMLLRQIKLSLVFILFILYSFTISAQIGPFTPNQPQIPWETDWDTVTYVKHGYFPVYLTGALPNDGIDDTQAINDAITIARDHRFVCYLPAGEYTISDQILAMLPSNWTGTKFHIDRRYSPSIVGEPENGGVILKLVTNASGFAFNGTPNDTSVVAAVQLWVQPTSGCKSISGIPATNDPNIQIPTDPDQECQGNAFNLHLKNITINLNGNANAVGVRAAGAQGCTIENVTVLATGAYAGFQNGFAEGGGMFNIKVEGGQYGLIVTDGEQGYNFHIAGGKFYNQTDAVFRGNSWAPSTFTGIDIIKASSKLFSSIKNNLGSPNLQKAIGGPPYNRGLSLIDAVVEITNASGTSEEVFRLLGEGNLYMKNVYIKGVTNLIGWNGNDDIHLCDDPSSYCHIVEYMHRSHVRTDRNMMMLEGNDLLSDTIKLGSSTANPFVTNLIDKHLWLNEPWVDPLDPASDIIIIDPSYGNDDLPDDQLLQDAINNTSSSGKIFLPRGIYYLQNPLTLKSNTQLFGLDKMTTVIRPAANFPNASSSFMIQTEDNFEATTSFSNIYLQKDLDHRHTSFIRWQAGQYSVMKNIMLGSTGFYANQGSHQPGRFYQVDNNGGGRWYAVCAEWEKLKESTHHDGFRMVYINGNQNPLSIYGLNTERCNSDVQVELNDADNVSIYHYKTEAGSFGAPSNIPLFIHNSNNVDIHTAFGLIDMNVDGTILPIIQLEGAQNDCINITNISSIKSNNVLAQYHPIISDVPGESVLASNQIIGTYKTCGDASLSCGLIDNFSFQDGLNHYGAANFAGASATFTTNTTGAEINIADGGIEPWHVNLSQTNLHLEQTKSYKIYFDVITDKQRNLRVNVANYQGGFTPHWFINIQALSPNQWLPQEFEFTMHNADDQSATLQFGFGGYNDNVIKLRNICLVETDCPITLFLDNYQFSQDIFQADSSIESNSKVSAAGYLRYNAGDHILLKPDFEVMPAAVFIADIIGCN